METKTDYLRVRLTREEKMRLDLNSTRQGMTISDYAKSGLRYQKVFGKQVEDIQTDWVASLESELESEKGKASAMDEQVALMEKSYELAAKYMGGQNGGKPEPVQAGRRRRHRLLPARVLRGAWQAAGRDPDR